MKRTKCAIARNGYKTHLTLNGYKIHWGDLTGKTIKNSTIVIRNYGDIHPFKDGPEFHAESAYIVDCDKNFVYYWVRKSVFPKLKHLYLLSHPCEPAVLHRDFEHIYLSSGLYGYKHRWADNLTNITSIERDDVMYEIASYVPEPMIE
jgi:hypothetical protein